MNSPVILERAKRFINGSDFQQVESSERLPFLYQRFFQREPTEQESEIASNFMSVSEEANMDAWQQYAHLLLMTNEFMFVD